MHTLSLPSSHCMRLHITLQVVASGSCVVCICTATLDVLDILKTGEDHINRGARFANRLLNQVRQRTAS